MTSEEGRTAPAEMMIGEADAGATEPPPRTDRPQESEPRLAEPRVADAPGPGGEPAEEISFEQIRERAYDLWERNHRPEGLEIQFWLVAERELRAERERRPPARGAGTDRTEDDA